MFSPMTITPTQPMRGLGGIFLQSHAANGAATKPPSATATMMGQKEIMSCSRITKVVVSASVTTNSAVFTVPMVFCTS